MLQCCSVAPGSNTKAHHGNKPYFLPVGFGSMGGGGAREPGSCSTGWEKRPTPPQPWLDKASESLSKKLPGNLLRVEHAIVTSAQRASLASHSRLVGCGQAGTAFFFSRSSQAGSFRFPPHPGAPSSSRTPGVQPGLCRTPGPGVLDESTVKYSSGSGTTVNS